MRVLIFSDASFFFPCVLRDPLKIDFLFAFPMKDRYASFVGTMPDNVGKTFGKMYHFPNFLNLGQAMVECTFFYGGFTTSALNGQRLSYHRKIHLEQVEM